jgi:hypothetical protein
VPVTLRDTHTGVTVEDDSRVTLREHLLRLFDDHGRAHRLEHDQFQRTMDRTLDTTQSRLEAIRESHRRELEQAQWMFSKELDAVRGQVGQVTRLVYMGLGMAVLFPVVLSVILVLTRS